jgi:hypothetical protein
MREKKGSFTKATLCAELILCGGGAITLSVFLYFLYYYATGERQFSTPMGAAVYWVVPIALSGFLYACLELQPAFKISLAIVCLSLVAVVYGAELFVARSNSALTVANKPFWGIDQAPPESKIVIAKLAGQSGVKMDTRDRVEVLSDLRKRKIDAVPAVMLGKILDNSVHGITGAQLFPIGGIARKVTVLCNELGQYVTYESDEHGFRNPRGIWKSARADMAVLGESFAGGYCVPNGETFADLFRKHYSVVLNLGMSGESSLLQLAAIKEYLPRYAPKIVLWVFSEGIDLYDLRDEAKSPLLMRYLEPNFSQHLLVRQREIDHMLGRFITETEMSTDGRRSTDTSWSKLAGELPEMVKLSNLRSKLHMVYGITGDEAEALSIPAEANHNLFRDALAQARDLTRRWGGTLYFVYLPSWERYGGNSTIVDIERTRVLKAVSTLDIPIIDIQPAFQAQSDPLALFPMRRFGHYNELGNQIVAETVLQSLAARGRAPALAAFPTPERHVK